MLLSLEETSCEDLGYKKWLVAVFLKAYPNEHVTRKLVVDVSLLNLKTYFRVSVNVDRIKQSRLGGEQRRKHFHWLFNSGLDAFVCFSEWAHLIKNKDTKI